MSLYNNSGSRSFHYKILEYAAWQFPVPILQICFGALWFRIDTQFRQMDPYVQMAKSEGGSAEDTVCNDLASSATIVAFCKVVARKRWSIALSTLIALLTGIVMPVIAAGLWEVKLESVEFCLPMIYAYCILGTITSTLSRFLLYQIEYSVSGISEEMDVKAGLAGLLRGSSEFIKVYREPGFLQLSRNQMLERLKGCRFKLRYFITTDKDTGAREFQYRLVMEAPPSATNERTSLPAPELPSYWLRKPMVLSLPYTFLTELSILLPHIPITLMSFQLLTSISPLPNILQSFAQYLFHFSPYSIKILVTIQRVLALHLIQQVYPVATRLLPFLHIIDILVPGKVPRYYRPKFETYAVPSLYIAVPIFYPYISKGKNSIQNPGTGYPTMYDQRLKFTVLDVALIPVVYEMLWRFGYAPPVDTPGPQLNPLNWPVWTPLNFWSTFYFTYMVGGFMEAYFVVIRWMYKIREGRGVDGSIMGLVTAAVWMEETRTWTKEDEDE